MSKKYIIFILILAIIGSCKKKSELENLIPENLGDLKLSRSESTTEFFFKSLIPNGMQPAMGLKAEYSNGEYSADLYLLSYKDTLSAITAFHHLMRGVRADTINYKHIVPRFDQNMFFIMALKEERLNYFFTKSTYVYWLNCEKKSGENLIGYLLKSHR
ncbi:MAG: hypothetical protein IGBAC_2118 [Ignavibacteriae bacterium]|nr:MAG: hypothetical protein IGBAC_2118 [Ignavibacteriota bacterium]